MDYKVAVVVTTINYATKAVIDLAKGCQEKRYEFIVIGDKKSPEDFSLEGCRYYSLEEQRKSDLRFATLCPEGHYARKNIGYLIALESGCQIIIETDDDNIPTEKFWNRRPVSVEVATVSRLGWTNVYKYFSDTLIWPRGLPLDEVSRELIPHENLLIKSVSCPIQQGLADANPDVDAIYRLLLPLPQVFRDDRQVALLKGVWCPFNSQNTTWWKNVFPLLYLPYYCSFRMTDIWRSFIAQINLWLNDQFVLFHEPTVIQERNEHDLMKDFADEVPGYLRNRELVEELSSLPLRTGAEHISGNMLLCYEHLVKLNFVEAGELPLLEAWLMDIERLM